MTVRKCFALPLLITILSAGALLAAPHEGGQATAVDKLATLTGFKIELLRSAQVGEGSWVSMAVDSKGRLFISPQEGVSNILRVTLTKEGQVEKVEKIALPVGSAMGLLYAFDSLYVNGRGPDGLGLYRLRDTTGSDQFNELKFLRKIEGAAGEHGSHGIVLGPDKMLYLVNGNFTKLPQDLAPTSPHRNYADDLLLGRMEDGNGFGAGNKPPGGHILRLDPEAKTCELFAAGQRNDYDIAFNADGELFGFDSDMEWDWATPWYRPIRINHIVSGADFGFREGTGKWPNYYPDSLPTTLDIGIGSPTGVKFGTDSNFPKKYQRALYAMDWTYGRILAVHLTPEGATYRGTYENFVCPAALVRDTEKAPLNVTDLEFGRDGAMYFATGGRGTQSGLYRVSYVGPPEKEAAPAAQSEQVAMAARELRHKLEAFHGKRNPAAIEFAWPHLNSTDRWIRYAARIAIESQPVSQWQNRALEEKSSNGSLSALLALARCGEASLQKELLEALERLTPDQLNPSQKLEALRVLEVCFVRMGRPDEKTVEDVLAKLGPLYPAKDPAVNRELCQLLVYLEAPDVIGKSMALFAAAPTAEEQLTYLFTLRSARMGWTLDQRKTCLAWLRRDHSKDQHPAEALRWFKEAGRGFGEGASYKNFSDHIRKDYIASFSEQERTELASLIAPPKLMVKVPSDRHFVKEWKTSDLLASLDSAVGGRSFSRGKKAFEDAQCLACHRFGDEGGATGPDITAVSSRFTRRDILESILEPSKVISDQYQNITVATRNGDDITGRLVEENDRTLVLITNPLTGEKTEVRKRDVRGREVSKVSAMPEGLVNILSRDEILDMLAYIEAGGNKQHTAFKR
jgi:putative heme-binding domain-containing protein